MNDPEDDDQATWDPLGAGAASLPPVLGGGCLARFDPASLNDESGTDFASLAYDDEWPIDR